MSLNIQRRTNWRETSVARAPTPRTTPRTRARQDKEFVEQFKTGTSQSYTPNTTDSALSTGVGILGAASLAAPALAPFAAAAGVGYGVYKLGETFKLW
jgi:hypothetical protein